MESIVDYLVLGSGLSSLSFAALMAKQGHTIKLVEAHESFGGYGHTFQEGPYKFNAHLHYVVGCGEGEIVNSFLKKLGLDKIVTFTKLDSTGYDRGYCEGKQLKIPYTLEKLQQNLVELEPTEKASIAKFMAIMFSFREAAAVFPRHWRDIHQIMTALPSYAALLKYRNKTLQEVFDECQLPKILQTLISCQLLDYLLPPKELSFLVWASLFNSYCKAAYYPVKHFENVITSVTDVIRNHGGELISNCLVTNFILEGDTVKGVHTQAVDSKTGIPFGPKKALYGKNIICNMDPKQVANMIGMNHFSKKIQRRLNYDYSGSSFVLHGAVKDIDLRDYGFGSWNIWHCQLDHNKAFDAMCIDNDYSSPYFAMNSSSLHSSDRSNCLKKGQQIFQLLAPANYEYWHGLKLHDRRAYNQRKMQVLDQLLDVVEAQYIPKIRDHLAFRMVGTPTTNERYVLAPKGGAYGVKLTPRNFQLSRKLTSETSLKNFYFCSAASGVGGFGGTIMTGVGLYETLSGDRVE